MGGPPPPALLNYTSKRLHLRTFLPSYPAFLPILLPPSLLLFHLPITFQLPIFLPSYPPHHHFHSTTGSPTAPISQPSNHQATVVDVNSSYSFYMECGGFTMRVKEPCPAVSWFGEFLNNNFKLVISYSFNHLK